MLEAHVEAFSGLGPLGHGQTQGVGRLGKDVVMLHVTSFGSTLDSGSYFDFPLSFLPLRLIECLLNPADPILCTSITMSQIPSERMNAEKSDDSDTTEE